MIQKRNSWFEESIKFYGDSPAPTAGESSDATLSALTSHLPALMQAYNKEVGGTEQAKYDASAKVSPQYTSLLTELYKQFAPQLAKAGSDIDTSTRTATAKTDADILKGSGADIAKTYTGIDQTANPEYYATRAAESKKLGELLGSFNLDSPNVEAERNISQENARTGNINTPSATNTVSNALQFGNEKLKRQAALGSAIGTATAFLQPANNPGAANAATTTLSKTPSQSGVNQFAGVTPTSNTAYSAGEGLLNTVAGFQNNAMNINANNRDVLDRVNQTIGAVGSL